MTTLQARKAQANVALVAALEAVIELQAETQRDQMVLRLTALETQNAALAAQTSALTEQTAALATQNATLATKNTALETQVAALEVYSEENMKRAIAEQVDTQVKKRMKTVTTNIGRLLTDNSERIVEEEEAGSSSRRRTVTPRVGESNR
jgi:regulator of replication initiation timing